MLADMRGGAMKRFLYEGDVKNSGKMGKFIGEFFDGKLKVRALAVMIDGLLLVEGACFVVDSLALSPVPSSRTVERPMHTLPSLLHTYITAEAQVGGARP